MVRFGVRRLIRHKFPTGPEVCRIRRWGMVVFGVRCGALRRKMHGGLLCVRAHLLHQSRVQMRIILEQLMFPHWWPEPDAEGNACKLYILLTNPKTKDTHTHARRRTHAHTPVRIVDGRRRFMRRCLYYMHKVLAADAAAAVGVLPYLIEFNVSISW